MKTSALKKKVKKRTAILIALVLCFISPKASAGDFSFGISAEGANAWFYIPQIPVYVINSALGGGAVGLGYEWLTVKDDVGKIPLNQGNYFGFKARDLFNHFGYGLTFGYQPKFSPFGIFINAGYKFRQFRMQAERNLENLEKYKAHTLTAGVTLRVTPLLGFLKENGWSPIIEIGTNYNKVFSCRAPYNNDTNQFGSGFSTRIGAGVRLVGRDEKGLSIAISYEFPTYKYFKTDFVAPDGSKPYANIKSKTQSIYLRFQVEF